jgi:hypothetical protein
LIHSHIGCGTPVGGDNRLSTVSCLAGSLEKPTSRQRKCQSLGLVISPPLNKAILAGGTKTPAQKVSRRGYFLGLEFSI